MSMKARRSSRRLGLKKGFRRENGRTPRHRIRGLREAGLNRTAPDDAD